MPDAPPNPSDRPEAARVQATRYSLLSRLKDWQDHQSWRDFFDTYWRLIHSTAMKAGLSNEEAEEVVQETILSVAKNIADFKVDPKRGSFRAWLLNTVRWRITDQFRKRGKGVSHQPLRSDDTSSGTDTVDRIPDPAAAACEAEWNREWEENLLESALDRVKARVKPELFQIFHLLATRRWSAGRVAQRLQVNLAKVYYARFKVGTLVKRELRRLQDEGI
ncbi:MAG TPA: sigma-70 family RNA polymerase sigma factor [Verrucomicrobiota bacterium]|nr:RNA polymerase subunit sigma [Verrucomicrobiales bacterium]HRI16101.1 sigma-70 family RNA polymerase sigma factor [Verrucomicrobiota bacterium]